MQKRKQTSFQALVFSLIILFGISGVFSFFVPPVSYAQEDEGSEDIDEKEDELKEELEELEEKAQSYKEVLEVKQQEEQTLTHQITSLQLQERKIEQDIVANEQKLNQVVQDINRTKNEIAAKEEAIKAQKVLLAGLLRSYYDRSQQDTALAFSAQTAGAGFMASVDQLDQVQEKVGETLQNIVALREKLVQQKEGLEEKEVEIENLKARLETQDAYLENTRSQKEVLLAETKNDQANYNWRLNKTEKKILEVQREIQSIEAAKAGLLDLDSLPDGGSGVLAYPVKSVRITQYYGKTSFSHNYHSGMHNGVDFGGPVGTGIYSAEDGKVIGTGNNGKYDYGKWVVIEHEIDGKTLITLYGHLDDIDVDKGDKVDRGDKIGKMGNTGFSTGPHLHFTVFQEEGFEFYTSKVHGKKIPVGAHVNPMRYL